MRLGTLLPRLLVGKVHSAANLVDRGAWVARHSMRLPPDLGRREALFDLIGRRVGARPATYLELGVYRGDSLRYVASVLTNPDSVLHGFDSFEGLPDSWAAHAPVGAFTTGGQVPVFDDPRITVHKGRFEDLLPGFRPPVRDVLVVTMDADLYGSTLFALRWLRPFLRPETYLYFDELTDPCHEMRAFDEFLVETGLRFELLGMAKLLDHALFRLASLPVAPQP